MRIGELATKTGVSVRALRYYEERELLIAERSAGGQRRYPDSAVDRVRWIQRLFAAGLPSSAVRRLLPCVYAPAEAKPAAVLNMLRAERDRIDAQVAGLVATRDRLAAIITGAHQCFDGLDDDPAAMTDRGSGSGTGPAGNLAPDDLLSNVVG